jgi:hypothetical protein
MADNQNDTTLKNTKFRGFFTKTDLVPAQIAIIRLKITVSWDNAASSLVEVDRSFRGIYYLHHQKHNWNFCQLRDYTTQYTRRHTLTSYWSSWGLEMSLSKAIRLSEQLTSKALLLTETYGDECPWFIQITYYINKGIWCVNTQKLLNDTV